MPARLPRHGDIFRFRFCSRTHHRAQTVTRPLVFFSPLGPSSLIGAQIRRRPYRFRGGYRTPRGAKGTTVGRSRSQSGRAISTNESPGFEKNRTAARPRRWRGCVRERPCACGCKKVHRWSLTFAFPGRGAGRPGGPPVCPSFLLAASHSPGTFSSRLLFPAAIRFSLFSVISRPTGTQRHFFSSARNRLPDRSARRVSKRRHFRPSDGASDWRGFRPARTGRLRRTLDTLSGAKFVKKNGG